MTKNFTCTVCGKTHEGVSLQAPEAEIIIHPGMYNDGFVGKIFYLPCNHVVVVAKQTKGGFEKENETINFFDSLFEAQHSAPENLYVFLPKPDAYAGEKQ